MQDLTIYEQALMQFLTMTPEERSQFFKRFKIGLSQADRDAIKAYTLANTNIKPTPMESVAKLNSTYPAESYKPDFQAYKDIYLIESGTDEGHLYWFNTNTMLWTKSILYEDSVALSGKVNKDMVDWGTMPTNITDKKTFYREASKVFATANHSIYMFGTPDELQRVWDIWGKPEGLKATHVYIAINAISTQSNRHAFVMWVFASNYGNPYFRIISGYNGSYTGTDDKGWVNVNKLVTGGAMDAADLITLIHNPYEGLSIDLTEDGMQVEIHLDGVDVEGELAVKRFLKNNSQCQLAQEEVARCRGLRVFYKFSYQGNVLYQCQDIRLPRPLPADAQWFVSIPIPNPQLFSEKILIQYDAETGMLEFKAANGGDISATMQFYDVKCIK